MKTLYDILDLSPSAESEDIRRAYRRLSKRFHPDLNQHASGAEERFRRLNEAYSILSNKEQRRQYDASICVPAPSPFRAKRKSGEHKSNSRSYTTQAKAGTSRAPNTFMGYDAGKDDLLNFFRFIIFAFVLSIAGFFLFSSQGKNAGLPSSIDSSVSVHQHEKQQFLELYNLYPHLISRTDARRILDMELAAGYTEQLWLFLRAGEMQEFEKMIDDRYYYPYLKSRQPFYEKDQRRSTSPTETY